MNTIIETKDLRKIFKDSAQEVCAVRNLRIIIGSKYAHCNSCAKVAQVAQ
jgi:hypothetical protein